MIDYEIHCKAFDEYMQREESAKDDIYFSEQNGWCFRAEIAQAEEAKLQAQITELKQQINKEREHYTEYRIDTAHLEDEINELKKEEIKYKEKHGHNSLARFTY